MMVLIVLLLVTLGALSMWLQPWLFGYGDLVNASVGAVIGLVIGLLSWWVMRRYLGKGTDGLKRWWQAMLLSLVGGVVALILFGVLSFMFSLHPVFIMAGGLFTLMMMLAGFALGLRGPIQWHTLWASSIEGKVGAGKPKVLDTSVIIDGRISDLVNTGFIEGRLILTHYVLQELHAIADSSEPLRRRKGRRGLDILGDLRRSANIELETTEHEIVQHRDVDHKLIELAKLFEADLVTTDYNLNKVAKVEGVRVLNINELANAVKPRYLPGEELDVEVIDKGEESGQGVGYLDDGTMVVVENGRNQIGNTIHVVVSSTLQTDAGKMLFVRMQSNSRH